jgi:ABC-type lipoprotein export system ATPase subunit
LGRVELNKLKNTPGFRVSIGIIFEAFNLLLFLILKQKQMLHILMTMKRKSLGYSKVPKLIEKILILLGIHIKIVKIKQRKFLTKF